MLLTCQSGFETLLARELADAGVAAVEQGPGWVRSEGRTGPLGPRSDIMSGGPSGPALPDLAFPWLTLRDPVEVRGESVNALASRVAEFFFASLRGERIEAAWPSVWLGPQETVGLGRRLSAVESAFGELLKKKLSRVAKLAVADVPRGVSAGGGSEGDGAREAFDWLGCDLVEEPHHGMQHIVSPWLAQRWCRRFVINLKIGRVDAVALLRELRAPDSPFSKHAPGTRIRHLYHDREEFTVVGEVGA